VADYLIRSTLYCRSDLQWKGDVGEKRMTGSTGTSTGWGQTGSISGGGGVGNVPGGPNWNPSPSRTMYPAQMQQYPMVS